MSFIFKSLLQILIQNDIDIQLKTEIAIVLCSLAHGQENYVGEIVKAGAIPHLFACLNSTDMKLVEACSRALRTIFQYPPIRLNEEETLIKVFRSFITKKTQSN